MRRKQSQPYLFIFCFLFLLMSIPLQTAEKMKGSVAALLGPSWESLANTKLRLASFLSFTTKGADSHDQSEERLKELELENTLLMTENERLRLMAEHDLRLNSWKEEDSASEKKELEGRGIPAKVIFRSPSSWNSSLWLNVGANKNEDLGCSYICKNSPVMLGKSVIGVIDYVGKKQARVKLITDSGLTLSVRVHRGSDQKTILLEKVDLLLKSMSASSVQDEEVKNLLNSFKEKLKKETVPRLLLAKGELNGCSKSSWRSQAPCLRGIGFNYDFADQEGPARDLRTGIPEDIPLSQRATYQAPPLVRVDDLLVTTGMDGIFPEGLHVAKVVNIHPLKEGDYFYELDAEPTAGDMNDLSVVFILPPLGFNPLDLPPPINR
ncbi:rod shape-determining protein MreC [Parachlamydia acanthamoebae]|jgi:cell shape-determining protein MreC|uniref:Cell shape-determining protein MreC n=2 Tax=Parachlamydia acanthamoebae TaxID=83552 RepID=F8KV02_PARAV|nr:rod shape-determining protein MreC [Parachlamydia acanthamoebae]CCB85069.1 putative uncharacterized protein [Parachlamydia acanthamoebae UV-7]